MTEPRPPTPPARPVPGWAQPRVWHFAVLVVFVAIAITDVRDQRITEPFLIALAAGGLALYGLIAWFAWWAAQRFERRWGALVVFIVYSTAMGVLFLVATVIYLLIAHVYRGGHL